MQDLGEDGIDPDQDVIDAAWITELRHRIDDIESGRVELLDIEESHAQLRAERQRLVVQSKAHTSYPGSERVDPNPA